MVRNYINIALRNLWRNRLLTTINVLGLAVGLACVVVLILIAQKGLTWDNFHPNGDRVYTVQTRDALSGQLYNQTVYPILDQMLRDYPEVETGTHIQRWNDPWISYGGKTLQEETSYVDSTFFRVFPLPLKYGSNQTALQERYSVVLSEKMAQKLFGDVNPLGRRVTLDDTLQYTVTGVLATIPANSSLQFEVMLPAANLRANPDFRGNANWYNTFARVFVLLRPGTDVARLEAKLPQLVKAHFAPEARQRGQVLTLFREYIHTEAPSFRNLISGAIVIAVFLLLILSINLINLNTASALPRAKEVAVRKVVGATKRLVLSQFWVESGVVVGLALVLAWPFAVYYLIPRFNALRDGNMQLSIGWATDYPTILTVLGVALLVALIAGTYPALYLLGLKTTEAVKGKLSGDPRRGRQRQNALIVLQFTLAVLFILCTIGMRQQLRYMKTAPLGYDPTDILVFKTDLAFRDEAAARSQGKAILNSLRTNSSVESFCSSELTPARFWSNFNDYYPDGEPTRMINVHHVSGALNFTETFGIPMLEGRNFSDATPADSAVRAVVINESMMRAFGWKTAVGRKVRQKSSTDTYTIVGVTKDYHYRSLSDKIGPMLQFYGGHERLNNFLSVRLRPGANASALIADLEQQFKKIPARRALTHTYLTDEVNVAYKPIESVWQVVRFVTIIAILTACAGIFGLITLVARQRTKEIGVRKVLGASVFSITTLLSRDFMRLVGLAVLIAAPIGWWVGSQMLSFFAYREPIRWWYLALAALMALGIALLSVIVQAVRAALANPVQSLRSE
jgi:putative ABC transport system permease protein